MMIFAQITLSPPIHMAPVNLLHRLSPWVTLACAAVLGADAFLHWQRAVTGVRYLRLILVALAVALVGCGNSSNHPAPTRSGTTKHSTGMEKEEAMSAERKGEAKPDENANLPAARTAFDKRANQLMLRHEFDSLLAECDAYIRKDPTYARAYLARSLVWKAKDEIDKVIADRTKALSLLPPGDTGYRHDLHESLGMTYMERGQYKEAISHFDTLVLLAPTDAMPHLFRAMSQFEIGEFDEALASVNRSINLAPDDPMSYAVRAKIWTALGHEDKAESDRRRESSLRQSGGRP